MKIRKLNRIKSRTAPFRRHWCHRCDMKVLAADQRCPICHFRNPQKRMKNFAITDLGEE